MEFHDFSYFQYIRHYKDGSIVPLFNDTAMFTHFMEMNLPIFSSYTKEHHSLGTYWFLWDEELPTLPVHIARDYHGFYHGLTLIRRWQNYYEMFAVALSKPKLNVSSFYMSLQNSLEHFFTFFTHTGKDIIYEAVKRPLRLPPLLQDKNCQQLCLKGKRIYMNRTNKTTYLTPRELECIRLILQGHPYKEIGQILDISARTVETYVTRIRERFEISHLREFNKILSGCP